MEATLEVEEDTESQGRNLEESSRELLEVGPLTPQERRMKDQARPGQMFLGIQARW